jgi:hypothetical protein
MCTRDADRPNEGACRKPGITPPVHCKPTPKHDWKSRIYYYSMYAYGLR